MADRQGQLQSIDPVLGTRLFAEGVGDCPVLAVAEDRRHVLTVNRQGQWGVRDLRSGEVVHSGTHSYFGALGGFFAGEKVVLYGDEGSGARTLMVFDGDRRIANVRLPQGVCATLSDRGGLLLCRATAAGLEVLPLAAIRKGRTFRKDVQTGFHRLCPSGPCVLGLSDRGIAVWTLAGGQPKATMRILDLPVGAVSPDGRFLSFGTPLGAVGFARLSSEEERRLPNLIRAFGTPVTCLAFASRGNWLATGAEGLRIWSWDDREEPPDDASNAPVPA